jgi:spoIIIJ-associated protein
MERVEASAKTVDEAVAKALKQLGLDREQVDVEIVTEGRPGILGFGGEPARVIVTPLAEEEQQQPAPVEDAPARGGRRRGRTESKVETDETPSAVVPADTPVADGDVTRAATEILEQMLKLMHVDARVTNRPPVTPGDGEGMVSAVLDVHGDDLGMLIGRRGETLASLQYVVNLRLQRRMHSRVMEGIDVGGYRRRREESLRNLATRLADRVRATGQSITMEPMPPNERRIVHITLQDHPNVLTVSIGEGEGRKVAITPRR